VTTSAPLETLGDATDHLRVTQLTLLDSVPYQAHSDTSWAAAEEIQPHLGRLQRLVLAVLAEQGPLTDNELIEATGLSPSTARPRRIELVKMGRVRQCGETIAANGRRAALWEAVT
jgi:hypothetical protein